MDKPIPPPMVTFVKGARNPFRLDGIEPLPEPSVLVHIPADWTPEQVQEMAQSFSGVKPRGLPIPNADLAAGGGDRG